MAQADNNVPQIGPRSFYSLVGVNPSLLKQKKASGNLTGVKPVISSSPADPSVSGGKAEWIGLDDGGLFAFDKKSVVVESLLGAGITWTIVDPSGTTVRTTPSAPFKLLPNEYLKATGGNEASCIDRLDAQRTL